MDSAKNRSALKGSPTKTRFWLSYDLGLQADYSSLYIWLDKAQAMECGDGAATFLTSKTRKQVAKELVRAMAGQRGRLYLTGKNAAGKPVGGFVVGGRKRAPWAGFGESMREVGEEE